LGEPDCGPIGPEGRKAHGRSVDGSSLGAVWSLLHDEFFFIGVTNVGYRRVEWKYNNIIPTITVFIQRSWLYTENDVKLVLVLNWFYRPMRSPFIWSAGLVQCLWLVRINWPVIGRTGLWREVLKRAVPYSCGVSVRSPKKGRSYVWDVYEVLKRAVRMSVGCSHKGMEEKTQKTAELYLCIILCSTFKLCLSHMIDVRSPWISYDSNKLTNKMQQFHKFITWRLCVAQQVSSASSPIIRSLQLL
jgi:hypothetical protein